MAVTLTCPRCTRTTTLLDADPVRCPFCSEPPRRRRRGMRAVRVYFGGGDDPVQVGDALFAIAFLGFLLCCAGVYIYDAFWVAK